MTAAVLLGLSVVSLTVFGVDRIRSGLPAIAPAAATDTSAAVDLGSTAATLLLSGTFAGVLVAAVAAWLLLAPIVSYYRRGGLAMASAFAAILLMLVCMPVHQLLGQAGLLGLAVLALCGALVLGWQSRRVAIARSE